MAKFDLDAEFVRKLSGLLKETGLTEIEYSDGDRRIRCASSPPAVTQIAAPAPVAAAAAAPEKAATPPTPKGTPIVAPMVGTAYLSPEPGASPFVKAGDKVKAGDTLLIIEAMKVMNPIKAAKAGTVLEILAEDAKPVEFGETLMIME